MEMFGWTSLLPLVLMLLLSGPDPGRGKPIVGGNQQYLGRADNCKSVSIPASYECGPGLMCSPKSGTCVPAGYHLKETVGKEMMNKRLQTSHKHLHNKLRIEIRPGSLPQVDEKLPSSPWSWNRLRRPWN